MKFDFFTLLIDGKSFFKSKLKSLLESTFDDGTFIYSLSLDTKISSRLKIPVRPLFDGEDILIGSASSIEALSDDVYRFTAGLFSENYTLSPNKIRGDRLLKLLRDSDVGVNITDYLSLNVKQVKTKDDLNIELQKHYNKYGRRPVLNRNKPGKTLATTKNIFYLLNTETDK